MLTFDAVTEELDKIVTEFGSEYAPEETCVYANDKGAPSCIVGHLLYRLDRAAFEDTKGANNYELISVLASRGLVEVESQDLKRRLQALQSAQDTGSTWAEAVKENFHGTDV